MAFCKYCGTQLEDGQICSCPQSQAEASQSEHTAPMPAEQQPAQQSVQPPVQTEQPIQPAVPTYNPYVPAQQPAPPQAYPSEPSKIQSFFSKLWKTVIRLAKKPVSTGIELVNEGDRNVAFGFIGIQSLLTALLLLVIIAFMKAGFGTVISFFLLGAIGTFGMACLLPLGLILFSKIFKKNLSFNRMLCVSGINSIFSAPFIVIGILLALISGVSGMNDLSYFSMFISLTSLISWPIIISFAGTIIGNFVTYGIVKESENMDKDSFPYIMFFNQIALIIIMVILIRIGFNICF